MIIKVNDNGTIKTCNVPDVSDIPTAPVASVNGRTGAVTGLIDAPSSPATGAFLVYNGTAWTAQTLSAWQGGAY